jgi:hypothetical protein
MTRAGRLAASITLAIGVGLARSRNAQQHLMLLAVKNAAGQGFDGLPLVTLGLVIAHQLEVHNSLYGSDSGPPGMYFRVNMLFRSLVLGTLY